MDVDVAADVELDVEVAVEVEVAPDSVRGELMAGLAALDPATIEGADLATVGRPTPTRAPAAPLVAMIVGDASPRPILSRATLGRMTAGDGSAVELASTDPHVSRRHLELWPDGDAVLCRDLGSRNGTVRVRAGTRHVVSTTSATVLVPGDVLVTAGDVVILHIVDPDAAHAGDADRRPA